MMATKTVEILLVEDNPGDVLLLRKALENSGWSHHLNVTHDGMEALDFLRQRNDYVGAPRPDLLLIDHNLPGKNGREILEEVLNDPDLAPIPFVVLSGSQWEKRIVHELGLPPDCYIVKPNGYVGYLETAKQIEDYWRRAEEQGVR